MTALSGYRIMWLLVMFDLPVTTKPERKRATRFRKDLLDLGFQRSQYSIYLKLCAGKEQVEALQRQIAGKVPKRGSVHLLAITDKQYENIVSFHGTKRESPWRNPDQFTLF